MSIIKAYTLPHPPVAIPHIGRGKEKEISDTLAAADEVAKEIEQLAPETIIYVTPHNVLYADYFHISPGKSAQGDFGRFGAAQIKLETVYDTEFADKLAELAEQKEFPAGTLGEKDKKLDHGVMVPMWFINNRYTDYKTLRISQSGLNPAEHYRLGRMISEAAEALGRRTILIASSDLSHKLTHDGPYGYAREGAEFEKIIARALTDGDFLPLFEISEELRERAAECGYNSLMVLAGCMDKRKTDTRLFSHEGPFGVGYAVASFSPGEYDASRDFLAQYEKCALDKVSKIRADEDIFRSLARRSLEHKVMTGNTLTMPDQMTEKPLKHRAGVFVSLHLNGQLRGCIGTIAPTTQCIADEIIQNAVSAGLRDTRFIPVRESELPYLTYKVDVLAAPEPITDAGDLNVKRYGVIVSSGNKRGLLLPNLDGIDTVEEQINIAKSKAGITDNEPIKLERFEVTRYE